MAGNTYVDEETCGGAVYDLEEKKYHYHNHEFSCSAAVYDNDAAKENPFGHTLTVICLPASDPYL